MKNREIEIKLSEIYNNSVSSRSSISIILDKYRSDTNLTIIFNFAFIAFLSRSAAQQLVLERKSLEKNNIKFSYINIDLQLNKILELAAHKLERKNLDVVQQHFESSEELNNFLVSF